MKKLALFTISILTIFPGVKSQNYVAFPTEGAHWNVYLEYSIQQSPNDTVLLRYVLNSDTVVNQVKYNRLCLEEGNLNSPTIRPIGGIREENKIVYFIGNDFLGYPHIEELILYDFSKQVGDTVFHNDVFYSRINNIDSVVINGEYRKRYKVKSNNNYYFPDDEYWIEGIGSVKNGLLGHITMIPTCCYHFWEHICFEENNEVKYLNPAFDSCFPANLISSVIQKRFESDIIIYPNPVDQELIIENRSLNEHLILKIIDIKGSTIKGQTINPGRTKIVLPNVLGILNVVLINEIGQILKSEKIVKK